LPFVEALGFLGASSSISALAFATSASEKDSSASSKSTSSGSSSKSGEGDPSTTSSFGGNSPSFFFVAVFAMSSIPLSLAGCLRSVVDSPGECKTSSEKLLGRISCKSRRHPPHLPQQVGVPVGSEGRGVGHVHHIVLLRTRSAQANSLMESSGGLVFILHTFPPIASSNPLSSPLGAPSGALRKY
jgi:hypothetical protein